MSTINHSHYFEYTDPVMAELMRQKIDRGERFSSPEFVGQGWSKRVGSDTYGGYVVSITDHPTKKGKKIYGLVRANTVMHGSWTEGFEDCSMPDNMTPCEYIIQSGWNKEYEWCGKTYPKTPKFYFCDKDGNKFNGHKCCYGWNGAASYRDPSFQRDDLKS